MRAAHEGREGHRLKVLPANIRDQVKEAIGSDMTKADALKLEKLLQKHGIGKYAAK